MLRIPYIAYLVLKEALHRMMGLERDASVRRTAFTLAYTLGALGAVAAPVLRAFRPRPLPRPDSPGVLFGYAGLRHVVLGIGGEPLQGTPLAGVFITGALGFAIAKLARVPIQMGRSAAAAFSAAWRRAVATAARAARA